MAQNVANAKVEKSEKNPALLGFIRLPLVRWNKVGAKQNIQYKPMFSHEGLSERVYCAFENDHKENSYINVLAVGKKNKLG